MKAVIMESHESFAIALRDDGQFVRVKGSNLMIGSEITIKEHNRSTIKKVVAAAACVCIMATGTGTYNYFAMENYSVVSLDINPSIEYSLNRFDRVVSVKAVNIDSEAIVADISSSVVSKDIKYALETTVDSLQKNNYIKSDSDNYVFVSVYSKGERNQLTLSTAIDEFSHDTVDLCSVKSVSVSQEEVESAENLGITAGKLVLAKEAAEALGESDITDDITMELASRSVEELTQIMVGDTAVDPDDAKKASEDPDASDDDAGALSDDTQTADEGSVDREPVADAEVSVDGSVEEAASSDKSQSSVSGNGIYVDEVVSVSEPQTGTAETVHSQEVDITSITETEDESEVSEETTTDDPDELDEESEKAGVDEDGEAVSSKKDSESASSGKTGESESVQKPHTEEE